MSITRASSDSASASSAPKGRLPARMRVLSVTTPSRASGWLGEAFATDLATQVVLEEVVGDTAALARLREDVFDAVVVSHVPPDLDALDLIEGLRAGGHEEPMIILGSQSPQELESLAFEVGADDYCCVAETTVRGLLWRFARAIHRHELARDYRRLVQAERHRLQQEHLEAQRLLEQQRLLIADLEVLKNPPPDNDPTDELIEFDNCLAKAASDKANTPLNLPQSLVAHYRELLRTYVIMGVGNLTKEMSELSELLAAAEVSAQSALQLHVTVLEELVQGLGSRSARHVMNRADLLILEVMGHLADGYRQRLLERRHPVRQKHLPGFPVAA